VTAERGASPAPPDAGEFYRQVLETLHGEQVAFLVGGACALEHYAGVVREVKDIDIFVRPSDVEAALAALSAAGFATELTSAVWLGKARRRKEYADIIFCSGNGIAEVDDAWFRYAEPGEAFGVPVLFCPVEETIWSKAYVMERDRYDGGDVAHLIRSRGSSMDWVRLLGRFGTHWPVLLSHVVLFDFSYPTERAAVPSWVMEELLERQRRARRSPVPAEAVCRGTLLSKLQYRIDIERWGYRDGRLPPDGRMTAEAAAAIDHEE
jgi:hypothetical protein